MNKLKTYWVWLLSGSAILLLTFSTFLYNSDKYTWADWTGFGEDKNISQEETLQNGKLTVTKRITQFQSSKTLWDWLGLAGVIAIPIVLYQFQQQQQKRSEEQANTEKEIAAINLREEALRDYIDKMAELLIDKELKILLKQLSNGTITRDDPKLDAVLDIARARTLSILRRLEGDGNRKGSVVHFLVDAELIEGLDLLKDANLKEAYLYKVNLFRANLFNTNLSGANLSEAKLFGSNLTGSDLSEANLSGANLSGVKLTKANLSGSDLFESDLSGSNLVGSDLSEAKLYKSNLSGSNLSGASLSFANLSSANLSGADLSRAMLIGADLSNANLVGANLPRANLVGANFSEANLSEANLSEVWLLDNNLSGAILKGVKGLSPEKFKATRTKNREQAIYDPDFREKLGLPPEK